MPAEQKRIGYPFPPADRVFKLQSKDKKGECQIEEFTSLDDKRYVIATELAENKGVPLSKGADDFITAYIEQIPALERGKEFVWIERWASISYKTQGSVRETFDLVEYTMEGTRAVATSRTRLVPESIVSRILIRDLRVRAGRSFR
jgi:hypothetical protein